MECKPHEDRTSWGRAGRDSNPFNQPTDQSAVPWPPTTPKSEPPSPRSFQEYTSSAASPSASTRALFQDYTPTSTSPSRAPFQDFTSSTSASSAPATLTRPPFQDFNPSSSSLTPSRLLSFTDYTPASSFSSSRGLSFPETPSSRPLSFLPYAQSYDPMPQIIPNPDPFHLQVDC